MDNKREFFLESEDGAKAHLIMSLSRFNNVRLSISVNGPDFMCTDTNLHVRINRKTGRLSHSDWKDGHTLPFPYAIPKNHRDDVCDALEEIKELSKRLKAKEKETAQQLPSHT